ncbi:hypothetical protein [Oceanobacillus sp. FSL W7-1309]
MMGRIFVGKRLFKLLILNGRFADGTTNSKIWDAFFGACNIEDDLLD